GGGGGGSGNPHLTPTLSAPRGGEGVKRPRLRHCGSGASPKRAASDQAYQSKGDMLVHRSGGGWPAKRPTRSATLTARLWRPASLGSCAIKAASERCSSGVSGHSATTRSA